MLTGLGFASVYIARSEVVSPESLTYAAFFLLVYLVAHVVTRLTVPYADPYLLPMAGLLTAIGLTEIYRLNPDDAFRQGLWVVIGVALFAATLVAFRHDYRRLESYKYVIGVAALALLVLPALPGVGSEIRGARLWVERGAVPRPAGRVREDPADRVPRGLPAREARGARPGPAEGLRPAAPDLGRRDGRARADERPRVGASLLRDLPRDALRRDGANRLRRRRDGALPRRERPSSTR